MATYFQGNSDIQGGGDGLQTLILMNPAYVGYSDNQQPSNGNFVFLNSNSSGNAFSLPHAPPSLAQHFVGIPLQETPSASAESPQDTHPQDVSALHGFLPRVDYSLCNQPMDISVAREATRSHQGLSLSLSSQQSPRYRSFRREGEVPSQPIVTAAASPTPRRADDVRASGGSPSSASGVSDSMNGVPSVLLCSKYLKATQELLDEVVNVGKGANRCGAESSKETNNGQPSTADGGGGATDGEGRSGGGETSAKRAVELTTAERQEIQMKKAKLVAVLDEVEQRYRQYHHQMQIVISWFEQAAGTGSARTYSALALETISKQFRCLKDAILGQIRAASKSLGEEESSGRKIEGSRLKYVDNQIRQQRALQQLGVIQHNAWRPQRGLPERSVSVLRAWLFEHFLHPYPKDSDKLLLAKQTGLTRSQVSNWFINARVRLWKPMVEEIYMEEMKENEKNESDDNKKSKSEQSDDSASKSTLPQAKSTGNENPNNSFVLKQDNLISPNIAPGISMSTCSPSPTGTNTRNNGGLDLIRSSDFESITQGSSKKPRSINMLHSPNSIPSITMDSKPMEADNTLTSMAFGNERHGRNGFTLMGTPTNFIGGFGSYPMPELGRFGAEQFQNPFSTNGVSLTLGLPHCENLSLSGAHQNFMPNQNIQLGRGVEIDESNDFRGMNTPTSTHSTNVYQNNINNQNQKVFATQLLPDFVT